MSQIPKLNDNSNSNQIIQSQYSLQNKENYKTKLDSSINEIMDKYLKLITEYLLCIVENLSTRNVDYNIFIIIRGLETITHVFSELLFYSNNLDMTYFHSQKSFYFYVEFIGQISEDQHSFLHLSSRDASIFVYKKTIFEIHDDIIKKTCEKSFKKSCEQIFDLFDQYKYMIFIFVKRIISILDFKQSIEIKKQYLEENKLFCEKITDKIIKEKVNSIYFKNINNIMNQLDECKNINNSQYFSILEIYLKKYDLFHDNNIDTFIIDPLIFDVLSQNLDNPEKFIKLLLVQN
jgi:hypothetical protein